MYEKEIAAMIAAAKKAEIHILKIYNTDFDVEIKSDDSPVTAADKGADDIMRKELTLAFPEYGFLTEESKDTGERLSKEFIWIIDPVDGTKEFVSRNGQFTTNIALARNHEVVASIIHVPALGVLYYAVKGEGSYRVDADGTKTRLHVSDRTSNLRVMRSISFFNAKEQAYLSAHAASLSQEDPTPIGAALKFCRLAEGEFDFFFRGSGNTKEWDVAAGDLILSEAGGYMVQPNGLPFSYNREDVYNRDGYIMANKKENLFLD